MLHLTAPHILGSSGSTINFSQWFLSPYTSYKHKIHLLKNKHKPSLMSVKNYMLEPVIIKKYLQFYFSIFLFSFSETDTNHSKSSFSNSITPQEEMRPRPFNRRKGIRTSNWSMWSRGRDFCIIWSRLDLLKLSTLYTKK